LHILNGNAAQTPKEVRDAAADAANATEPTTLYVAADMTVDADMLASLEAAAVNPNVSFEVVGAAGGLKPNGSKTNISKNLLSKTNGILKSGDKDGDIVYDYFYVRDLTRNDVPSGAPTIRTNKMDIGDMLESASMMSTLTKAGLTPMGGASTISAIIPDTTYWKRDNHLQDCSALSALQDWPYTIKVLLEYCQDLSGGVPAFGGVNDAILDIMGHEDSGHPLSTDKHPVLGKAFVSGQEGGATEVQQVGATKLEYGTGSHSAEKVIESTMSIQDGRSLKIHSFKRASLPIKFSEETRYRNTATLPTHGGGPVFQPGLVTLIYSSLLDSISNAPDKQISNSLGINLTIDATTTAIRISENDSIKWLSTLSADADVLPFLQNYMVLQMLSARGITVVNRYEDNNGNGTLLGDKHRSFYWYNPHDDAPFQNAVSYDSNATSSTGPSSTPQSSFDEKMMAKQRMEKKRMQAINRANTRGH
jgi:hypothetical protein